MDKPYWTVGKLKSALEAFALVHQHAIIESVAILNSEIKLMIRYTLEADHQWWSINTAGETKRLP